MEVCSQQMQHAQSLDHSQTALAETVTRTPWEPSPDNFVLGLSMNMDGQAIPMHSANQNCVLMILTHTLVPWVPTELQEVLLKRGLHLCCVGPARSGTLCLEPFSRVGPATLETPDLATRTTQRLPVLPAQSLRGPT